MMLSPCLQKISHYQPTFATTYYQVIIKATGNAISTQIGCSSTRKTPKSELSLFIVQAHILTFSKKAGNANIQPKQFM